DRSVPGRQPGGEPDRVNTRRVCTRLAGDAGGKPGDGEPGSVSAGLSGGKSVQSDTGRVRARAIPYGRSGFGDDAGELVGATRRNVFGASRTLGTSGRGTRGRKIVTDV